MSNEVFADPCLVAFHFHCRTSNGTHILEYQHAFPRQLSDHDFGSRGYFEVFKKEIDPMQGHMKDCLAHSCSICQVCEDNNASRVVIATKYVLHTCRPLVKNITTAICNNPICKQIACRTMKIASDRLNDHIEHLERSLWPQLRYSRVSRDENSKHTNSREVNRRSDISQATGKLRDNGPPISPGIHCDTLHTRRAISSHESLTDPSTSRTSSVASQLSASRQKPITVSRPPEEMLGTGADGAAVLEGSDGEDQSQSVGLSRTNEHESESAAMPNSEVEETEIATAVSIPNINRWRSASSVSAVRRDLRILRREEPAESVPSLTLFKAPVKTGRHSVGDFATNRDHQGQVTKPEQAAIDPKNEILTPVEHINNPVNRSPSLERTPTSTSYSGSFKMVNRAVHQDTSATPRFKITSSFDKLAGFMSKTKPWDRRKSIRTPDAAIRRPASSRTLSMPELSAATTQERPFGSAKARWQPREASTSKAPRSMDLLAALRDGPPTSSSVNLSTIF